jgi:hypothetical protein
VSSLISGEMISLLAKAIAQKSRSFLRYGELARHLSDHEKFGQVLVEVILREQKHFETLSEIIPRLLESGEQAPVLELMAGNADDDHKRTEVKNEADDQVDDIENEAKQREVDSNTGDAGSIETSIETILLNQLLKVKRSLGQRDDFGSLMSLPEEEKSIGEEEVGGGNLVEEKPPAEAGFLLEKQAAEEVQVPGEDNVPEEILAAEKMQIPGENQEHFPRETSSLSQQEEEPLGKYPDASPKVSGLLVWTFGQTKKKGLAK